jgi:hypothetical protein
MALAKNVRLDESRTLQAPRLVQLAMKFSF